MATDEDGLQSGRPVQSDGGRTRQEGEWKRPRAEKECGQRDREDCCKREEGRRSVIALKLRFNDLVAR